MWAGNTGVAAGGSQVCGLGNGLIRSRAGRNHAGTLEVVPGGLVDGHMVEEMWVGGS